MLFLKIILVWLALVVCAVLNGTIREKVLNQYFDEAVSLPISGISLSALVLLVTYISIDIFAGQSTVQYFHIGLSWVFLTLAFEYGFGHYIQGKSWPELNEMFNVSRGNLFILVMLVTAMAPFAFALAKGHLQW